MFLGNKFEEIVFILHSMTILQLGLLLIIIIMYIIIISSSRINDTNFHSVESVNVKILTIN